MPETPEELKSDGRKLPRTGNMIVGTKGKMLVEGDYWNSPRLIPAAKAAEFGKPKQLLERSPGHHEEFIMACTGQKPREFSQSNFGYSGPMAANVQLGNLCAARARSWSWTSRAASPTIRPSTIWPGEPRPGWGPLK